MVAHFTVFYQFVNVYDTNFQSRYWSIEINANPPEILDFCKLDSFYPRIEKAFNLEPNTFVLTKNLTILNGNQTISEACIVDDEILLLYMIGKIQNIGVCQ